MNQSLSPAELEQRFAEINAREPEELTAEEAAALAANKWLTEDEKATLSAEEQQEQTVAAIEEFLGEADAQP